MESATLLLECLSRLPGVRLSNKVVRANCPSLVPWMPPSERFAEVPKAQTLHDLGFGNSLEADVCWEAWFESSDQSQSSRNVSFVRGRLLQVHVHYTCGTLQFSVRLVLIKEQCMLVIGRT